MSFWKAIQITDIFANFVRATPNNEMRTVIPTRLAGSIFSSTTVDPNMWLTAVTGSGSVTQSGGVQTAATGATANSTATVQSSAIARFVGQSEHQYSTVMQMGDTGTVNNVRRWGAFNGTDGCYFKLAGTTLNVATMKGGVETAIPSSSWNLNTTVPLLTNGNIFRISYRLTRVIFEINGVLVHNASFSTLPFANQIELPVWMDNVNSGGLATNLTLTAWVSTIYRMGPLTTQPRGLRVTTAGTYIAKYGAGLLHRITLNIPTGTLLTIYDNTAGSGTVLAVINTPAQANPVTLEYFVTFNIGLTIVSTGTWDVSVIFE